jgi:hypothetical protein
MKQLKDYILNENNFFKNLGVGKVRIENWLEEHNITKYSINDDYTIDVKGSVNLRGYEEKKLPDYIQFGKITEYFYIYKCPKLETLEGCPKEVGKTFDCSQCPKLESLEGAPKEVGGGFYCYKCPKLETLEGCPKEVGWDFWCDNCSNLKSLEGCPKKVGKGFYCNNCGNQFTQDDVKKMCKVKKD